MKKLFSYIIAVSLLLRPLSAASQNKMDSLDALIAAAKDDTAKVALLGKASFEIMQENSGKALVYAFMAKSLAEKIHDDQGLASSYNSIGLVYERTGKLDEAMRYYFESLKIKEDKHFTEGLANSYNSIGLIYDLQENYPMALSNYNKSLQLARQLHDEGGIAVALLNIGIVAMEKGDRVAARKNFEEAKSIALRINDSRTYVSALNNIGLIYAGENNFDSAKAIFDEQILIYRKLKDSLNLASAYNNLAIVYYNQGKPLLSADALKRAVNAASAIRALPNLQLYYENLAELYDSLHDYKTALFYQRQYGIMKDSIRGAESAKRIAELQFAYESQKKEREQKLQEEEMRLRRNAERERQRAIVIGLTFGVSLVFLIMLFFLVRYRLIRKQKAAIEEKNRLVEFKNKEITDSMFYASRIQSALLASNQLLTDSFSDFFVLYKPKDIVSGDFYWATAIENKFYLCVADCTGHGVPGAFMSLLNISYLNEAVIEKRIGSPDQVLDHIRSRIIAALNSTDAKTEGRDGMDAVLCTFDFKGMWLRFAAANNPLWLVRKGQVQEFTADKMPVGMHYGNEKNFSLQTIGLRKDDVIYLFSDGFADQFGGPAGKKFKYRNLQKLLLEHHAKPMKEQQKILENTLSQWMGEMEQVDDILVVGIRF